MQSTERSAPPSIGHRRDRRSRSELPSPLHLCSSHEHPKLSVCRKRSLHRALNLVANDDTCALRDSA